MKKVYIYMLIDPWVDILLEFDKSGKELGNAESINGIKYSIVRYVGKPTM